MVGRLPSFVEKHREKAEFKSSIYTFGLFSTLAKKIVNSFLDAVMNEDDSRITYKHAAKNLSRIRQIGMNFIKLVDMKGTLKRRQLKCALNTEFREIVLFGI